MTVRNTIRCQNSIATLLHVISMKQKVQNLCNADSFFANFIIGTFQKIQIPQWTRLMKTEFLHLRKFSSVCICNWFQLTCLTRFLVNKTFYQNQKWRQPRSFSFISNAKDFHDLSTVGKGGKTYTRCTMWIEFYICLGQTKALFALLMDLYYPKANFIWGSNYDMVGLDFISWGQKSLGRD